MKHLMRTRKRRGAALAEFGPALFLFFIVIFFPLMDLFGLTAAYACGWYANFVCTRELSMRRINDSGIVINEVTAQFSPGGAAGGLARFVGVGGQGGSITHAVVPPAAVGGQPVVTCSSQVTAVPFITVPFLGAVAAIPGLTGPVTFTIQSQRPREVTQN
ncbi:MAG: hypothetical protein K2W82_01665 [Candidatus Obscuribacterales bacterium]|nr:hypothetical protein [Candidatus Obscuribacterales bacterium]